MKNVLQDFFASCAGQLERKVTYQQEDVELKNANTVCFVGHNGLMDMSLDSYPGSNTTNKNAIILGCISADYFGPGLKAANAHPLLWTRGLMAPEAYTLEAALTKLVNGGSNSEIEKAAEAAYVKYQGVTTKGSNWLFKTGW